MSTWLDTFLAPFRPYAHGVENERADVTGTVTCPLCGGGTVTVSGYYVKPSAPDPIQSVGEVTVDSSTCRCDELAIHGRLTARDEVQLMGRATGRGVGEIPVPEPDRMSI